MNIKFKKTKFLSIFMLLIISSHGIAEDAILDKTYNKIKTFSVSVLCDEINNKNFKNKKSFCINEDQYNSCLEWSVSVGKEAYLNELNRRGLKSAFCKEPLPIIGGRKQMIYDYCESPSTTPEISSCIAAEVSHIDERIDQTYVKLHVLLKNRKDIITSEKYHKLQISWIKQREINCEEESMQSYPGTQASIDYVRCKKRLSTERLEELTSILQVLKNKK